MALEYEFSASLLFGRDIPFDTEAIAEAVLESERLQFALEDEAYIDDIPFNTGEIYQAYLKSNKKDCQLVVK